MKNVIDSENLIKNGHFASDSNWETDWNPYNAVAEEGKLLFLQPAADEFSYISQRTKLKPGSIFRVKLTITHPTSAGVIGKFSLSNITSNELEKQFTEAGAYQFDLQIPDDWQTVGDIHAYFSAKTSFMIYGIELYLLTDEAGWLRNGDFSENGLHWQLDGPVTFGNWDVRLDESASIEQTVPLAPGIADTLKFQVTSNVGTKGGGTVTVNDKSAELNFSSDGIYTLKFPADASDNKLKIRFYSHGSFRVEKVELLRTV